MNISYIELQERQTIKQVNKSSRRAIAVCILACVFMLVLQVACAFMFSGLNLDDEIIEGLANTATYIISLAIPFFVAFLVFKILFKNTQKYIFRYETPKAPLLYIFGVIGIGYLTTLSLTLLFPKFVEFYSMESGDVPVTTLCMILLYVSNALLPAILEEWAFRGIICKNLLPYGKKGAIIISSLLFGIMHIDPPRIIFTFVIGVLLAICYEITGSLVLPMVIHFLNNALSVTALLFMDESDVNLISLLFSSIIIALIVCGIIFLIFYYRNGTTSKKVLWNKHSNIGYNLSTGKYILNFIINIGIIPLILVYGFFYCLYFVFS